MKKTTLSHRKLALLALASVALLTSAVNAGTVTTSLDDLILGFYANGNPGQTLNLEVDLGNMSNFYNATGSVALPQLALQDLVDTYGSSWYTRTDLFWGAVATTGRASGTVDGHAPVGTLWATAPTGQTAFNRASVFTQKAASPNIEAMIVPPAAGALDGATSTSNSAVAAVINNSLAGSWSFQDMKTAGESFGYFNPTVDNVVGLSPGGQAVSLLYELQPTNTSGIAGTVLGSLVLTQNGLSFTLSNSSTNTYTITPSAGSNGTISPSSSFSTNAGSSVVFTATPSANYIVGIWSVDSSAVQTGGTTYVLANIQASHTVSVTFTPTAPVTYTITPSAGLNGTISPSSSFSTNAGSSVQFTATPSASFTVGIWSVDSSMVQTGGTIYTLADIQTNHTVSVTFTPTAPVTYTITPSAGLNGTISPSSSFSTNAGSSVQLTATPSASFTVGIWSVDSSMVQTGGTIYTLVNIQTNHTVSVTFTPIPPNTYTITPSAGLNGTISPSSSFSTNAGSSVQFTATPSANFTVGIWSVDSSMVQTGGTIYTLVNIQTNHTVSVTFAPISETITASAGPNGTINPSGLVNTNAGSNVQFTATPSANYSVGTWSVDSNAVQTGGINYTLMNIQTNHTVSVTFVPITYTVTPSAGANGTINPSSSFSTNAGSSVQFTATPSANFTVGIWSVDSSMVQTGGTTYTLVNIQTNHAVSVTFALNTSITYTITPSAGPNGTISPSSSFSTNAGSSVQFTATPSANYVVGIWSVDSSMVQTGGTTYTLVDILTNHTVSVIFTLNPPSFGISAAEFTPVALQGQDANSDSFEVWNAGGGALTYTISTNAAWLSVSPTSGNSSGATNLHTVTYNTANLSNGVYDAALTLSSSQAATQTIAVTLYVADSFDQSKKAVSLTIKVDFAPGKLDTASLNAVMDLPIGYSLTNLAAQLSIGHVMVPFTLDAKGKGRGVTDLSSLKLQRKGKATPTNQAFQVTADLKGAYNSEWVEDGLSNATTSTTITVPVLLLLDGNPAEPFYVEEQLSYKAKADKSGTAKSVK